MCGNLSETHVRVPSESLQMHSMASTANPCSHIPYRPHMLLGRQTFPLPSSIFHDKPAGAFKPWTFTSNSHTHHLQIYQELSRFCMGDKVVNL